MSRLMRKVGREFGASLLQTGAGTACANMGRRGSKDSLLPGLQKFARRFGGRAQKRSIHHHKRGHMHAQELDLVLHTEPRQLNILMFSNRYNSLSQRVVLEMEHRGHLVTVVEPQDEQEMIQKTGEVSPDMIICPFLTKRVPPEIWKNNENVPCLIVHPGVEGDRGIHSLDWAIAHGEKQWGVTVLEASEEMDTGDIWTTKTFNITREGLEDTLTKSSLYAHEVTYAAASATIHAVENYAIGVKPRPLDYANPVVKGRCQPKMTQEQRIVDWEKSAEEVALCIRASDSQPGAIAKFRANDAENGWTEEFRAFGVHMELGTIDNKNALPGQIIGQRDEAILVKCKEGAVWVSHLKAKKLKLPASLWLPTNRTLAPLLPTPALEVPHGTTPTTFQDIWMTVDDGVCFLHFNFYNGAMSTRQCQRLSRVLHQLREDERFSVVCLMGGYNFFSNGIHLNVIEAARDPSDESWRNINAIDDVVRDIFTMSDKITISAVQGNAGAGGCMMALAGDMVWARGGCVLNPSYRAMNLYGSEYHTYFFNDRVGDECAAKMTSGVEPLLAETAAEMGLVDEVMGHSADEFRELISAEACKVARMRNLRKILLQKKNDRTESWFAEVEQHREKELEMMKKNFQDPAYHEARAKFVRH